MILQSLTRLACVLLLTLVTAAGAGWTLHSTIEPTLGDEQEVCGEAQLYWCPNRQQLEAYYANNPNHSTIYRAEFREGVWKKRTRPVLGQGIGGAAGHAARTGFLALRNELFIFYCDLTGGDVGGIHVAKADLEGIDFAVTYLDRLPATPGVEWTRLNIAHVPGTYGDVRGLAEARYDGKWQVFAVSAPMPEGPYTVLNGGLPLTTLRPAGLEHYCGGRITIHADGLMETHYHANGRSEIYHAISTDHLTWAQVEKIIAIEDVPLFRGKETRQLADVSYIECPAGKFMSFTQVNWDFHARVVVMRSGH